MAEIRSYFGVKHIRSEASFHVVHYSAGARVRSGRGLSFWFLPLSASVAEVPVDDQELSLLVQSRSADFQAVSAQLSVTWRVLDPDRLADRVDFSIHLSAGAWLRQPLDKISGMLGQIVQQVATDYIVRTRLAELLERGVEALTDRVREAFGAASGLVELGLTVVNVAVPAIRPSPDVEKALQTPAREAIQQEADKATFERRDGKPSQLLSLRALAVDRERAISENELNNRIALAHKEERLIEQQGANERRKVTEAAEASRIRASSDAERMRLERETEAGGIRVVEEARVEAERHRIDIYRDLPADVLTGLALRDLATHLPDIDTLNISPDALSTALSRWLNAGATRGEA